MRGSEEQKCTLNTTESNLQADGQISQTEIHLQLPCSGCQLGIFDVIVFRVVVFVVVVIVVAVVVVVVVVCGCCCVVLSPTCMEVLVSIGWHKTRHNMCDLMLPVKFPSGARKMP
ncbi:unnamed protein product [Polarella glacialis]|uniref:Uncharacterized protein n=1 Tax=Polarella glacialis TaxID=89957 RepID=A0A813EXU4_POLGL|nr:unnamed protein product [Polarella glacialis]